MADLSPPYYEKIMFWYSVNYRTVQYIVKKMWSGIISPKIGPNLTPENDSKNMIGTSFKWLFGGSQKIVILGVCYKMGVSISKFASLENGGGNLSEMGVVQKSGQKHRKRQGFHIVFEGVLIV